MFDFTRITETIGGLLGQSSQLPAGELAAEAVIQRLADAGVDPAMLTSLGADEIVVRLNDLGIDPASPGAQEILRNIVPQGASSVLDLAGDLLSRRG